MFGLGELTADCVYRDVGWWGGAATVARRKCFENTSIHSMNLPIKVQQQRAELSSASIDDCCLTQLQRNQDFICGTRTMHIVIPSVARPWKQFSLSQLVFFQLLFSEVLLLYSISIR